VVELMLAEKVGTTKRWYLWSDGRDHGKIKGK
jgi:hypothetical protein